MEDDNNITYNHLRLNLNKFYDLKLNDKYQRTMLKLTWEYIRHQYKKIDFEDLTYKEQYKKLEGNCSYAGYSRFEN